MRHESEELAREYDAALSSLTLEKRLEFVAERYPSTVFTSSLGLEDQAITHAIANNTSKIQIVTLNTGRLFSESLALLNQTRELYKIHIDEFHPIPESIEAYKTRHGLNGFYENMEARQTCCHIRKIEPLQRALTNADSWVTGLRREQSQNRNEVPFSEWSESNQLMKFNLLADWTLKELNTFLETNNVPISALHARGYPSIGCEPCTRAIKPGESERAGRWWWENEQKRECGLHVASQNETSKQSIPLSK